MLLCVLHVHRRLLCWRWVRSVGVLAFCSLTVTERNIVRHRPRAGSFAKLSIAGLHVLVFSRCVDLRRWRRLESGTLRQCAAISVMLKSKSPYLCQSNLSRRQTEITQADLLRQSNRTTCKVCRSGWRRRKQKSWDFVLQLNKFLKLFSRTGVHLAYLFHFGHDGGSGSHRDWI